MYSRASPKSANFQAENHYDQMSFPSDKTRAWERVGLSGEALLRGAGRRRGWRCVQSPWRMCPEAPPASCAVAPDPGLAELPACAQAGPRSPSSWRGSPQLRAEGKVHGPHDCSPTCLCSPSSPCTHGPREVASLLQPLFICPRGVRQLLPITLCYNYSQTQRLSVCLPPPSSPARPPPPSATWSHLRAAAGSSRRRGLRPHRDPVPGGGY